jgi:hypothetical protein
MRVTRIGTAAIAAALGVFAPGAASAGIGPGPGTPTFTLHTLTGGAASDPRVVMQTDTTALASFVDYATRPAGIFHVCQVPLDATSCARTTAVTPTDEAGDMSLVFSGPQLILANGSANSTETFTSGDGGATFGPAVRVSRYANAENVLPLPDGRLLLVGRGNDSRANDLHVVVVPPDGSGVDTAGFSLPNTDYPGAQRGVADNGDRYVVLGGGFRSVGSTQTQIAYAVYDGSGDPNAASNWTQSTLPLQFDDAPNIAGGPSGVVLVAVDAEGAVVASKLDGTTFPAPTRIGDPAGKAHLPNVTQDATGRITATWQVNGRAARVAQPRRRALVGPADADVRPRVRHRHRHRPGRQRTGRHARRRPLPGDAHLRGRVALAEGVAGQGREGQGHDADGEAHRRDRRAAGRPADRAAGGRQDAGDEDDERGRRGHADDEAVEDHALPGALRRHRCPRLVHERGREGHGHPQVRTPRPTRGAG